MKPIWEEFYDSTKDRRYGLLFFSALLMFLGVAALGGMTYAIAGADTFGEAVHSMLPAVGIFLVVLNWQLISRARRRREEKLKFDALSRDELAKARSKLRNGTRPIRPVDFREPDTDLKY